MKAALFHDSITYLHKRSCKEAGNPHKTHFVIDQERKQTCHTYSANFRSL